MKADDAPLSQDPVDGIIRFYLTWNGHRYRFGLISAVKPLKVQLSQPDLFTIDSEQLPKPIKPVVSTAFEVNITPYEYHNQLDSYDAPMRQGMYVESRLLRSGDYIIFSDEEFKMITEEPKGET